MIPVIDVKATGENINRMRKERNLSTLEMQSVLGLASRMAIYKWFNGQSLPTLDNMVILASMFGVSVNDILVLK